MKITEAAEREAGRRYPSPLAESGAIPRAAFISGAEWAEISPIEPTFEKPREGSGLWHIAEAQRLADIAAMSDWYVEEGGQAIFLDRVIASSRAHAEIGHALIAAGKTIQ